MFGTPVAGGARKFFRRQSKGDGGRPREVAAAFLEPNGLTHTSPGPRPGWVEEEGPQAEGLPHKHDLAAAYEADLQPAIRTPSLTQGGDR